VGKEGGREGKREQHTERGREGRKDKGKGRTDIYNVSACISSIYLNSVVCGNMCIFNVGMWFSSMHSTRGY